MKKKKGFTLIELLVVVLIIGILAAIAIPQYQKAVEKSRAAEALILMKSIYDSANLYKLQHGLYPNYLDGLDIDINEESAYFVFPRQDNLAGGASNTNANLIWASRKPNSHRYNLLMTLDTNIKCCLANADRYNYICRSFNGVESEVCAAFGGGLFPKKNAFILPW
jgi:prepilin-type N-terminal cleavage/methylation domain-containing protein